MVYGGCFMLKRNFIPISILLIIFALILQPNIVFEGAFRGLDIWIKHIVPFLFPMFILSNILLQYNFMYSLLERLSFFSKKVFKSKFALIPYFISFISGYPSGAMIVNIMANNKKMNTGEANYILTFTNNCSFQFIAAVVSYSMLGNFNLWVYIAIPHYLGAIILGFLFKHNENNLSRNIKIQNKSNHFNYVFSSSVYKAITSILTVGGVIVIFSVFSQYITTILLGNKIFTSLNSNLKDIIFSLIIGSLEITNGCSLISTSMLPLEIKLIIINFLISFSGMSIIFQTIAVTNDLDFNVIDYIKSKFILGIISSLLCILLLLL
jgi:sporulation integral membrane protein YlbJ